MNEGRAHEGQELDQPQLSGNDERAPWIEQRLGQIAMQQRRDLTKVLAPLVISPLQWAQQIPLTFGVVLPGI